ncbi:restriction endonuclease subunit S [Helicobacter pylori]|uniref:restriction endonuclease subunit S n=1 Tax=Helicobacter pylori TaxID=210 RepID=UPI000C30A475|nr:restriction endonuclease subunit S [Helicobacter pylori]
MIGPLSSQLNAIKWGEFRLGDLFEMERGTRLTKANRIKGTRPLVTAGYENYGVAEYISNHDQKVFKGNTITIDMFANAFYRYSEYSADDNILVLTPKFTMSYRIGLCVTARINAVLKAKFSYGKQYRQKDFNVTIIISLPLKPTANAQTLEDIDFPFMEKFIAELEQCRLAELEAYLKAAGLENTTLSSGEENALNLFNNSRGGGNTGLMWQSFKLGDLFEKVSARFLGKGDKFKATSKSITDTHNIPLVYCKKGNNGIMYWGKKGDFETYNNIISIIYNGVIATGLTYAHRDEVGILAESYFIKFKNGNPNFLCNLFIKTAIEKVLYPKYSRDNLATWANKVENESILLPTNPHGDIDFHFMRALINALMKQTIQGVAQYCSAKIQATKEVISQETPTPKDSLF